MGNDALTGGRLDYYLPPGGTRADLSMEYLIDQGVFICGDPDTVYDRIKRFYDAVGGFGVLMLVVGKDWGTHDTRLASLRRRSPRAWPR